MNNYPPGVTGDEPQITGEWPVDIHAPFEVGPDPDDDSKYAVYFGNSEDLWWSPFSTRQFAQHLADILNAKWSLRDPDIPNPDKHGVSLCRICGDIH